MQLTEAATLDRKSGEAEGSAVRHSCAPLLPAQTSTSHHRILMETLTSTLSFRVPGVVRGTADPSASLPGFPVEIGGVGELHAPFLTRKAHTQPCPAQRGRNSGSG
jgi:hypothetical protein